MPASLVIGYWNLFLGGDLFHCSKWYSPCHPHWPIKNMGESCVPNTLHSMGNDPLLLLTTSISNDNNNNATSVGPVVVPAIVAFQRHNYLITWAPSKFPVKQRKLPPFRYVLGKPFKFISGFTHFCHFFFLPASSSFSYFFLYPPLSWRVPV